MVGVKKKEEKGRQERYIASRSLMIFGVVLYSLMNNLMMVWLRYIVEQFKRSWNNTALHGS
jgi:hypothetical protein